MPCELCLAWLINQVPYSRSSASCLRVKRRASGMAMQHLASGYEMRIQFSLTVGAQVLIAVVPLHGDWPAVALQARDDVRAGKVPTG